MYDKSVCIQQTNIPNSLFIRWWLLSLSLPSSSSATLVVLLLLVLEFLFTKRFIPHQIHISNNKFSTVIHRCHRGVSQCCIYQFAEISSSVGHTHPHTHTHTHESSLFGHYILAFNQIAYKYVKIKSKQD